MEMQFKKTSNFRFWGGGEMWQKLMKLKIKFFRKNKHEIPAEKREHKLEGPFTSVMPK